MTEVLTTVLSTGITLTSAGNPLTITATGGVDYATGTAIYGPGTQSWSIVNDGTVIGLAGISLAAGGYISNASSGVINATAGYGVNIAGLAGTVINAGSITATKAGVNIQQAAGTVINSGSITSTGTHSYGIYLTDGGAVTNTAGAFIEGHYAIAVTKAAGTIYNAGTILGNYVGIYLGDGGTVTNAASAMITNVPLNSVGIYITGTAGTVTNAGTIISSNDVVLKHGGTLVNSAGGQLGSTNFGAGAIMTGGTVTNAGLVEGVIGLDFTTISGTAFNTGTIVAQDRTVTFAAGGFISNAATGLIESTNAADNWAVRADGAAATVQNSGTILAGVNQNVQAADAILLDVGGIVVNTGLVDGQNLGVYLKGGGTITNSGTIIGSKVGAVQFAGNASNRLVITPGAVFQGAVTGGSGTNTMELAGTSAATLSGLGTQFTGFSQFVIDSGANWTVASSNTVAAGTVFTDFGTLTLNGSVTSGETIVLSGSAAVLQLGTPAADAGVIATVAAGDTIVLDGIADATAVNVVNGDTLAVSRSGNLVLDLALGQAPSNEAFGIAEHTGNAVISVSLACFAGGTCLDTPDGPRAVEDLRTGDRVRVSGGEARPVRWVGYRRIDLSRRPDADDLTPVIVQAHAFADGIPRRDVRLSPDHAVLIGGMLIPIRLLLNGGSIRRDAQCRAVTYYHVELETHDIMLAEGLPAESYLDTGNRAAFENGGPATCLHPDFDGGQPARLAGSCAPFADAPEQVEPVWRRLADRSGAVSGVSWVAPATTREAELRVVAGTLDLSPVTRNDGRHVFVLPPQTEAVGLVSRCAVPSETRPWIEDRRRLGVMISRLTVRESGDVRDIPLDHPALGAGWWAVERHGPAMRRWTNGSALLPVRGSGPLVLQVDVAGTLDYPVAWQRPRRAA